MIPVPASELIKYDADNENDGPYKDLIQKEIRYINRHTPDILKHASVLYKQKQSNYDIGYIKNTVDFYKIEKLHDAFIADKETEDVKEKEE